MGSARERLLAEARGRAQDLLDPDSARAFLDRLERRFSDFFGPLQDLYGPRHDAEALAGDLVGVALRAAASRPAELRELDRRREAEPDWFQREGMVAYSCYVDRFAGTLRGVGDRLDDLEELGITYLHLLPIMLPRPTPNDGGYAVMDYRAVDPRLGTIEDLEDLGGKLRQRGISLCLDLVLNHTAAEHEWAARARAGDPEYREFFYVFPDRTQPDLFEVHALEVFPDLAPGNFTWVPELEGWVWTTFYDYQWDLNYTNPRVFEAMLDVMLYLANRGAEILRLDAVPYLWKRLGTTCANLPEVHLILQAFRGLASVAAPALLLKAEAISPGADLVRYLGTPGGRAECDLAYQHRLMALSWATLATGDASVVTVAQRRLEQPRAGTAWLNYVRCHDHIAWGVEEEDAEAVGVNRRFQPRFLQEFFSGTHSGSFARGVAVNQKDGKAGICGTAASLCGLETALEKEDPREVDQAIRRLILLYSVAFSYGGVPLIFMGDEIGLPNDRSYLGDPSTAQDHRWLHRPWMDWEAAARRTDPSSVEGRIFGAIRRLVEVRVSLPELHATARVEPLDTDNRHVFAYARFHPDRQAFLGLANFTEDPQSITAEVLRLAGLAQLKVVHSSDQGFRPTEDRIELAGLGFAWLTSSRPN